MWTQVVCPARSHAHILQAPPPGSKTSRVTGSLPSGPVSVLSFPLTSTMLTIILNRYKAPAGPRGVGGNDNPSDPKGYNTDWYLVYAMLISPIYLDYLKLLIHPTAVCDCCVTRINGEWFRCAYCPKDLCDACEALDTHDDTHIFFVFKAPVSDGIMCLARKVADFVFHHRLIWITSWGNLPNSTTQMEARPWFPTQFIADIAHIMYQICTLCIETR